MGGGGKNDEKSLILSPQYANLNELCGFWKIQASQKIIFNVFEENDELNRTAVIRQWFYDDLISTSSAMHT